MNGKHDKIFGWLKDGISVATIARLSGIEESSVVEIVNGGKSVPAPSWLQPAPQKFFDPTPKPERDQEMKQRYEGGERISQLAREYNLDPTRVRQIIVRKGASKLLHVRSKQALEIKRLRKLVNVIEHTNGHAEQPHVIQFPTRQSPAPRHPALPEAERLQIAMRYATGESTRAIAADYGIKHHSVAWMANKLGYFRPGFGPGVNMITRMKEYAQQEQQKATAAE